MKSTHWLGILASICCTSSAVPKSEFLKFNYRENYADIPKSSLPLLGVSDQCKDDWDRFEALRETPLWAMGRNSSGLWAAKSELSFERTYLRPFSQQHTYISVYDAYGAFPLAGSSEGNSYSMGG